MATDGEADLEPRESIPVSIGKRLGRYVLAYEIASGGMATVYLARFPDGAAGTDRMCAVKVVHPHLAKERAFVDMFLDEARIAARIVHPNVATVFDFGEEAGSYFLAMEYLMGETAHRLCRAAWKRKTLATSARGQRIFARVVAEACEGLHAAHELRGNDGKLLGVVHRDVTPHNLFANYDGSVRVVDFGIAVAAGRSHKTTTGTLKGKYPYMSPEQVQQEPLDRRSDVWSLGVCLWEMLTGRRLFGRDGEFETLKAVTSLPVPLPSAAGPHVPKVFDPIVARALERDRERRYATAREMGRDLAGAAASLGGATVADVGALMDLLFADEKKARLELMESARRLVPLTPTLEPTAPAIVVEEDAAPLPLVVPSLDAAAVPLVHMREGAGSFPPERPSGSIPIVVEEPEPAPAPKRRAPEPTAPIPLARMAKDRPKKGEAAPTAPRDATMPIPLVTTTSSSPPEPPERPAPRRHGGLALALFFLLVGASVVTAHQAGWLPWVDPAIRAARAWLSG